MAVRRVELTSSYSSRPRGRRRLLPFAALATVIAVMVIVVVLLLGGSDGGRAVAEQYVNAWSHGRTAAMYALLDSGSQRATSERAFAAALAVDARRASLTALSAGQTGHRRGAVIPIAVVVRTRLFGTLRETLLVTVTSDSGNARVRLTPALLFPGLRGRERLSRTAVLPQRGTIFAAGNVPLAAGTARSSSIPDVSGAIAGVLEAPTPAQAAQLSASGFPRGTKVGHDGLERIFESRLAGIPGNTLLAGRRVLARRPERAGTDVHTTIVPTIERALLAAMAGRYAGMVALDPRTGAVLGAAGVGFSALQPPGSTMKIVTATGVLSAGIAHTSDAFPVATEATIDGFPLQNANGEACGGTLIHAFAVSCNSVFAPLGVRLGASRFLATAARFGFNQPSPIPGEPASTIPPADVGRSALELGASAIGQGKVQTTTLEMTDVAATIAMGGRRPVPTLLAGAPARFVTVTSRAVAAAVQRMMVAVVTDPSGTGTAAAIPGVEVAGKTGTAELRTTVNPNDPTANSAANTDAWFVGYAPVGAPRIVVGALFPGQGAGGATAAPAVALVLRAALGR